MCAGTEPFLSPSLLSTPATPAGGDGVDGSLLDLIFRHAQIHPESVAVHHIKETVATTDSVSYSQLVSAVHELSGLLRRSAPMGDGGVVLLRGPTDDAPGGWFVAWIVASLCAGVRVCLIPSQATAIEVESIAKFAGAFGAIGSKIDACPSGLIRFDVAAAAGALRSLSLPAGKARRTASSDVSTGGVVLLSSGTTGASKLVVRSLAALSADARQVVEALALRRDDSVAAAMPLCHSYGVDMMVAALLAGAALHVHSRFDPAALAADLRTGATVFPGVPFMYEALARADHTSTTASSGSMALRLAFSAGTPLHPRIAREMQRVWGLRIGQLYGLSELGSVTFNNPDSSKFDSASVGVPMRGVEIRIVDPDDSARVMESGVEGHVAIRARSMLSGYMPAEAPVLVHGFFPTGDLGKIDAAGRLYITGRLKLLIDVGGLKVNPLDVEAVLATHPDVAECVVVPLVVSDTVMRVRAVYVASDPLNPPRESELRAFMKERVSAFKVPRVFERVEVLPRSASGKVLRGQLMGEG